MQQAQRKKKTTPSSPGNRITRNKYLRDPQRFAPRFQRLARALAQVSAATLSHEECETLLEFYVDSEKRGENARRRYLQGSQHLKTCPRCQTTYDALTDAVSSAASRDLASPESRIELPFLRQASNPLWSKQIHSPIAGGQLGFAFTLAPRTVASAFAAAQFAALRGSGTPEKPASGGTLLLADSVVLGSHQVDVELRIRSDQPNIARLEISVVPSAPLPEPLRVNLHLNDTQYPAIIEHGHASIDDIPLSDLENAQVRVEFEAGPPENVGQISKFVPFTRNPPED